MTSYVGSTGKVLATISVGRVPNSVVVARGTDKAYVTNEVSNTVSVISTMTREVIKTIKVPSDPHHIRTSRDGRRLYVSEYATNKVAVINTSTDSVVAEYATNPNSAARNHSSWITRDRKTLYLVNEGVNEVTAVDARSGDRIFSLAVGNKPSEIIVAPNGKRAYVSIPRSWPPSPLPRLGRSQATTGSRQMDDIRSSHMKAGPRPEWPSSITRPVTAWLRRTRIPVGAGHTASITTTLLGLKDRLCSSLRGQRQRCTRYRSESPAQHKPWVSAAAM